MLFLSTGGLGNVLLGHTSRLGASAVHAGGEEHASWNLRGMVVWTLQIFSDPVSAVCALKASRKELDDKKFTPEKRKS